MKYSKPKNLSDPYYDWHGYEKRFNEILSKDASQLGTEDYWIIFHRNLPAADYEEGCYFLEFCFSHIKNAWDIHDSSYPDSLLWWIDHFQEKLKSDGLWDDCLIHLKTTIGHLLNSFELFDLDEEKCKKIGRDFSYSIGPYNQSTVTDLIDDLTIFDSFEPFLNEMIDGLINSNSISNIRWYVDIAFHTRSWCTIYNDDELFKDLDNFERKEALFHKLHTFKIYQKKREIASEWAAKEKKWKYNRLVGL